MLAKLSDPALNISEIFRSVNNNYESFYLRRPWSRGTPGLPNPASKKSEGFRIAGFQPLHQNQLLKNPKDFESLDSSPLHQNPASKKSEGFLSSGFPTILASQKEKGFTSLYPKH